MLSRPTNAAHAFLIDEEMSDEKDFIEIKVHRPSQNNSESDEEQKEEELIRLLSDNDSDETTDDDSETPTPTPTPVTPFDMDSPLSAIQHLFFQPPKLEKITYSAEKPYCFYRKEIKEIDQVLGYMELSLKMNLMPLIVSKLSLKVLVDMHANVSEDMGKKMMQAIAQQKIHIDRLRWAPYFPTLLAFPLIPGLWKIPFSLMLVLLRSQINKHCYSEYSNDLKKLEHIAISQKNLYEKKEKITTHLGGNSSQETIQDSNRAYI